MLLIKNGYIIDPANDFEGRADILVKDGVIESVKGSVNEDEIRSRNDSEEIGIIDASGLVVAPGLIDTHAHFRDPGFTEKEDIMTGAAAAAKGGYTSVILMANTSPCVDDPEILERVLHKGRQTPIHIYSCANVTVNMAGRELVNMTALAEEGAVGFTDDGVPVMDAVILRNALVKAKELGDLPVSVHEEDKAFIVNSGINAGGEAAKALGLEGASRKAEISLIDRDLEIAIETMGPLCIQHISTKEGVRLVREARSLNPAIRAEATPHHFSLTEKAVIEKGTLAKVNPPIRTEDDRLAIIEGLKDGTITIIATDHAPHTAEEKARSFEKAPSGMIGLETALSLAIRELVRPGHLTLSEVIRLFTVDAAAFYHLNAGSLSAGAPADLVIFDPEEEWTVTEHFASKACNSPFIGETLPGVVHYTIASGKIAYKK